MPFLKRLMSRNCWKNEPTSILRAFESNLIKNIDKIKWGRKKNFQHYRDSP